MLLGMTIATANKEDQNKGGPFHRLSRTLQSADADGAGIEDDISDDAHPQVFDFPAADLLVAMKDLYKGGNKYDALLSLTSKGDMESAWSHPTYLKHVATAMPMIKTIKPTGEHFAKDTITAADVSRFAGMHAQLRDHGNRHICLLSISI